MIVKYQENMQIPFPNTFAESEAQLEAIYREQPRNTKFPVCVSLQIPTPKCSHGTSFPYPYPERKRPDRTNEARRLAIPFPRKPKSKELQSTASFLHGGSLSFSLLYRDGRAVKKRKESRSCSKCRRTVLKMPQSDGGSISNWPRPRRWEKPGW